MRLTDAVVCVTTISGPNRSINPRRYFFFQPYATDSKILLIGAGQFQKKVQRYMVSISHIYVLLKKEKRLEFLLVLRNYFKPMKIIFVCLQFGH